MSDPSSQPTQPLTAERAERANERADALDMAAVAWKYSDESVSMKPDVPGWLRRRAAALRSGTADEQQSEMDRLRAENTALAAEIEVLKAAPEILASPDKAKRIASLVASSTRLVQLERDDARREVSRLRSALGLDQDGRGQADE